MSKESNVVSFASLMNNNARLAKLPYFRMMRRIWLKQGVKNWLTLTPTKSMRKRRLKAQAEERQRRKVKQKTSKSTSSRYYTLNRYITSDK